MIASYLNRFAAPPAKDSARGRLLFLVLLGVLAGFGSGVCLAQDKKEEIPPPVELGGEDLFTTDGVQLKGTFFPGTKEKESVPIVLLHSWKGDRTEYAGFAQYLQLQGHAVLVPDLRGHGESKLLNRQLKEREPEDLARGDFEDMVYRDMEKIKGYLVDRNDAGELNLSKLCIIGSEMGATVAALYARYDWYLDRYEPASKRRGTAQDVKAVVLLSPKASFHGLDLTPAVKHPAFHGGVSTMIVVGAANRQAERDAKKIYNILEQSRPDYSALSPEERLKARDLFLVNPETTLQGSKMLGVPSLRIPDFIVRFIQLRLVDKDFPWRQRR
jgi:pimeloyl-ACP methyl ester carboxylesterase